MEIKSELDQGWSRIGRRAGYLAGTAFLVGTVLFLLDALGLLGATPEFHATDAGLSAVNGGRPVSISYRTHPSE